MKLRREKFSPDLIDLVKFEKDNLYALYKGNGLRPPHPIPGLLRDSWTDSEMQAMRENREKAELINNRISRLTIVDYEGALVTGEDKSISGKLT